MIPANETLLVLIVAVLAVVASWFIAGLLGAMARRRAQKRADAALRHVLAERGQAASSGVVQGLVANTYSPPTHRRGYQDYERESNLHRNYGGPRGGLMKASTSWPETP